ncbi:MAG: DegT/DnrJ/EryC1/StrS family aminotransferase [Verrucomicrobia bacterium]|nr:DegT/DnrJ/EryC1/StrS family aminotransferase [Verrucomicrobiota bacterium]
MQFINLQAQYQLISESVKKRIENVLNHGQYILGPEVTELETKLAAYAGTRFCVSTGSGTVSLEMALRALGIGPGDEVITVPYSFFATAEVVAIVGAKPVFVDIRPDTFCINESLIEQAVTPRTKAIIPVSLYGQMPDMEKINAIAAKHGLAVIEDGAQSFGAQQRTADGKQLHSCGASLIGSTSFYPAKPLGGYGEGGALFTNDEALYKKFIMLRNHGSPKRDEHLMLGMNARLDSIQAAILLAKMEVFEDEIQKRNQIADRYSNDLMNACVTPYVSPNNLHVYAQYTLRFEDRGKVQTALAAQGIPSVTHYSRCIHEQPIFANLGYAPEDFPEALKASRQVLCLPMSPYLTAEDQEKIIRAIQQI